MKKKIILLSISSLAILLVSMTLLQSSGLVPLPFNVMTEEEGNHDGDHQYPNYEGSISVSEDQETGLEELAPVTQSQAETTAIAYTTGGSVISSGLENENGFLVWKVVISFEGSSYEIVIDAGNGSVLWASSD